MLRRDASLLLLVLMTAGCDDHDADLSVQDGGRAAENWDLLSADLATCDRTDAADGGGDARTWPLTHPTGNLNLPTSMRETKSPVKSTRRWAAPDSSAFSYRVARGPMSGMVASTRRTVVRESSCTLPVAQHRALTLLMQVTDSATGRTFYAADASVVLGAGMSVNVWLQGPTPAHRARLLGALHELSLRGFERDARADTASR